MPTFRYNGRTARGEAVAGSLEAESADAIASHLFTRGITPTDIRPAAASQDALVDLWRKLGGGKPGIGDLILFSRQMYAITKAGLPLLRGMQSLAASTPNAVLRGVLNSVIDNLQAGRELSFALSRFPDVFSKFYVSVIRVGESSGTLDTAFQRMYDYLSMEKRIRDKLKTALRYPATVVAAIGIAITIITLWVLPRFAPIFAALPQIPLPTRVLMGVSQFASTYWYLVLAGVGAAVMVFRVWIRDPAGRYRWDHFKLRVPVIGGVLRRGSLAQIARSFALTLDSGVPIIQGLGMIARAAGNDYMTERVLALRDGVERGESLYRTAQTSDLFTPIALQMISIGEETGALGEMLAEVADFYEREVDHDLENLSSALEPLLIVAVGVLVLILALGVFLPLWDLASTAGKGGL
ncbi:MAG TPA: type II secretion system F family protein [Gammaproteobacteria bacterium]|nr:type II secretion system F family protein [Gammaproteobacteria bacterium]